MFNNTNTMGLWNPSNNSKPLPMVYRVKAVKGEWELEPDDRNFKLPNKLYGNISKYASRVWSSFDRREKSLGVLLVGLKGSGKTETSKLLANIAISEGMPVIMVAEIRPDLKLIKFLSNIKNAVIFIDEYGKLFQGPLQEKSLTMFSDIVSNKKLFILTENDMYLVNRFLLNRPGRLWYKIHYGRLDESVVTEYCNDHNVNGEFLTDLLAAYKTSKEFTFDHLMALVTEHLDYPNESFKDLIEIMNVEIGNSNMVNRVMSIALVGDKDNISFIPKQRKYIVHGHLPDGYIDMSITIAKILDADGKDITDNEKYKEYLYHPIIINSRTNVHDIAEDDTIYKANGFYVTVRKMEDNGDDESSNAQQRPLFL